MNIEEDSLNPIITFFHKLLGNDLWIIPISVAIASWIIFYFYPEKWIVLYVGIICSLIAILHICSSIFVWIKNVIRNRKNEKDAKEKSIKKREQEKAAIERKKLEHASAIWKLVAHLDNDLIWGATLFLALEIHDGDKNIRFVKIPTEQFSEESKRYNFYFSIIEKLTFSNGYNSSLKMIRSERVNDIMYFHFEPYFLSLLENFYATQKWIKI